MTSRRVVTLLCDKHGCRETYIGGDGHTSTQVRAEAKKLAGWTSEAAFMGTFDICRWHS